MNLHTLKVKSKRTPEAKNIFSHIEVIFCFANFIIKHCWESSQNSVASFCMGFPINILIHSTQMTNMRSRSNHLEILKVGEKMGAEPSLKMTGETF